jgi:hypothetical protein
MTYAIDHTPGDPFPWRVVRTRSVEDVTIRDVFAHFRSEDAAKECVQALSNRRPHAKSSQT